MQPVVVRPWQPLFRATAAHEAKLDVRQVFSQRIQPFQWRDEWEEIGFGTAVQLGSSSQVRFVCGQDETMKIVCNFIVTRAPKPYACNDKA